MTVFEEAVSQVTVSQVTAFQEGGEVVEPQVEGVVPGRVGRWAGG
ncbi:hypothetical protein [Streptomyces sp. NPDC059247]